MLFVCPKCGMLNCFYVDNSQQKCRKCGNTRPIKKGRLVLVIGPQASGKTTILEQLQRISKLVVLDGDLIRPLPWTNGSTERACLKIWLKICIEILQTLDTVVLCGNWTQKLITSCSELQYFSEIIVFEIVPSRSFIDEVQELRPTYRKFSKYSLINRIHRSADYNRYFPAACSTRFSKVVRIENSSDTPDKTAQYIIEMLKNA